MPEPVLISPADGGAATNTATFVWSWSGQALAANQAFEVRIWREGQPDHYGAAEPVRETRVTVNLGSAYGIIQGGAGLYSWTVAVVQRDPYKRIGPEAAPRRLSVQFEGGGGPRATWTPPPP